MRDADRDKDELERNSLVEKFCKRVIANSVPYWARVGLHPAGGFCEKLAGCGTPIVSCARRVRVQARQTFVYAYVSQKGWFPEAKGISDLGWSFLLSRGLQGGSDNFSGIALLLNADGSLRNGCRETYCQSFFLLAAAWRLMAYNDYSAAKVIEEVVSFMSRGLRSKYGGWLEGDSTSAFRRQNPHMHLLEAFMACYQATRDTSYLELATEIYDLFRQYFFDEQYGVLREHFNEDWSHHTELGDLLSPGHMMEWCWLLAEYDTLTGTRSDDIARVLYSNAIRLGLNEQSGLLYDQVALDGRVTQATSRLWSTMEFIRAQTLPSVLDLPEAGRLSHLLDYLFNTYFETHPAAGWYDKCDSAGRVIAGHWEASTFYHIILAVGQLASAFDLSLNE